MRVVFSHLSLQCVTQRVESEETNKRPDTILVLRDIPFTILRLRFHGKTRTLSCQVKTVRPFPQTFLSLPPGVSIKNSLSQMHTGSQICGAARIVTFIIQPKVNRVVESS